jgi:hypothetical protein
MGVAIVKTTLLSAALLVFGGCATPAFAVPVLDQSYTPAVNSFGGLTDGSGFQRAMTFTVGITGTLSSVRIEVSAGSLPLGLNILSTAGGVPTEIVLATGIFQNSSGEFSRFSAALPVTSGEVLALEPLDLTPAGLEWLGLTPNTYAGGQDYFLNPFDGVLTFTPDDAGRAFQTFVDNGAARVPEPLALSLFGAGLAAGGAMRQRRTARQVVAE